MPSSHAESIVARASSAGTFSNKPASGAVPSPSGIMVRPYDDCMALPHVRDRKPPWRPARFASVVVEELAEAIVGGSLAEGDVLPTEPALCEQFGFSRTVIREALKMLEERGLVRVEQGRGTSVQPRASWNLLDPLVLRLALAHDNELALLDDLIAVRRLLEQEMARAAAVRLTDDDVATLSGIV